MRSLFWLFLNFIGFVLLVFMYSNSNSGKKRPGNNISHNLFNGLLLSVMLFLATDTGFFFIDTAGFPGARELNYIINVLNHIALPLPGVIFLLYCDIIVLDDMEGLNKRAVYYLLPCVIYIFAALSTPFTHLLFYIDEHNTYLRGNYFTPFLLIIYVYIISVYLLLAVKTKRKQPLSPKGVNLYLYLFPIPAIIMGILQTFYYGVLLLDFGYVLSSFLLYVYRMQSTEDRHSLSVRFRNLSIILFAVISSIMMAGMFFILENVTDEVSRDYAVYGSTDTAHVLESYLIKEIGILETAAYSKAVTSWLSDEDNDAKKKAAYDELVGNSGVLHNDNIYIVVGESGHEYWVDGATSFDDFQIRGTISEDNPKDDWVFELLDTPYKYNLNVDYAKGTEIIEVWLNFKIQSDTGDIIGILCTRMEFTHIAEEALYLHLDNTSSRTLIIDENGIINMDSSRQDEEGLLLYGEQNNIFEEIPNPELHSAIKAHLDSIDEYFTEMYNESVVIALQTGRYRYATITPIGMTSWSVVTLYDSSSLFGITRLLPLLLIITATFILFAFSSNGMTSRMIFTPFRQLIDSLICMQKSNEQAIYGLQRSDEIGLLSNTIQDYFTKGYYDELTGIYNRRYLEVTLQQIMMTLSRAEYKLSVMFIDIDFFKLYNDTYGHAQGDKCLRIIAETLNNTIMRKGDFVARYGGEEFTVVLPYADEDGAVTLAGNMLSAIRDLKIPHENCEGGIVTVSIGVTTGDNTTPQNHEVYLKKADEALYMSKEGGRNRYTFLTL